MSRQGPHGAVWTDRRGVAAVEFALLTPVILVLLAGLVDLVQMLAVERKITEIAAVVSDLVAQETTLADSDVSAILTGASAIILPYSTSSLTITVSAVTIGTSSNTVVWAKASGTTAPSADTASTAEIPATITESGIQMIVTQVTYSYSPVFGDLFGTTFSFARQHLARPRESSKVTLE